MIVNHGIPSQASILDSSYDDWKKVMDIDLNGAYYVAKVTLCNNVCNCRQSENTFENEKLEI